MAVEKTPEGYMAEHELVRVIRRADEAINNRDFDGLMEFYSEDAVLAAKPGMFTRGKADIRALLKASRPILTLIWY
jgi:ketosteroid isomerase-like protein